VTTHQCDVANQAKTADTSAHDLGDDEDAVFVDYVPPRPVILRLRRHGAQEAQEPGPAANETVAKRAPSVGMALKWPFKTSLPRILTLPAGGARRTGSMSVDEIELRVEEARKDDGADASLVPGTLLPFTQVHGHALLVVDGRSSSCFNAGS
jgi:hypothetical protein